MAFNDDLTVSIDVDSLFNILTENRAKHRQIFEAAVVKYHEAALGILNEHIEQIMRQPKNPVEVYTRLPVPEDHTADYDRVLRMIELHTGDTLTISEARYREYVDDEWGWSRAWAGNTAAYAAG
jgi:hypothetical protein